jgi:hypothetical protein
MQLRPVAPLLQHSHPALRHQWQQSSDVHGRVGRAQVLCDSHTAALLLSDAAGGPVARLDFFDCGLPLQVGLNSGAVRLNEHAACTTHRELLNWIEVIEWTFRNP